VKEYGFNLLCRETVLASDTDYYDFKVTNREFEAVDAVN
jgi:hypothetical protein